MESYFSSRGDVEARPYQLELLDAALNEDTIVNLGTGAGKTFIAVMLIKELSSDILCPFSEEGAKRTVFLVTTVPLVKQQAEYIEHHTQLNVGQYTGDMGVDRWTEGRWLSELADHHILVMTMTIFKNILLRSYLKLSQVNLVVFDECHHAVKNHDYVQIMRLFRPHIEKKKVVPRRLGLTASLIPSKCKPGDIEEKVKQLEEILVCRSQTAGDLQQVARYATNPEEKLCLFQPSISDPDTASLKNILDSSVEFLELCGKEERDEVYETVKVHLDDSLHILINLGVWCANEVATEGLQCLVELSSNGGLSGWRKALVHMGWTKLKLFTDKCTTIIEKCRQRGDHTPFTPKVRSLLVDLGDSAISCGELKVSAESAVSSGEPKDKKEAGRLQGIVFVERRTTAVKLSKLIQGKTKTDADLRHIRCDHVLGHNEGKKGTPLRREAKMKTSKQDAVLDQFRSGRLNFLIATSVLEEGVDVPKCNSVVRFDFPPNFRSYIQSKGRARARVSKYLLFIEEGDENRKRLSDLKDYHALEKELQNICKGRSVPGEEDVLKRMEEFVKPYMPYGEDGAAAMLGSSLSIIHGYCQKLPRDKFTILTPAFISKKELTKDIPNLPQLVRDEAGDSGYVFQSSVQLPMNCPLKKSITGQWMPTKKIADKSAALEAIKKLHEIGELDKHLLPLCKMADSSDNNEAVEGGEEKRKKQVGTAKRSAYYRNEDAPVLTECFPGNSQNHLYIIMMHEESKPFLLYQSQQSDFDPTALGIITSKPVPHAMIPEFSLYDGDKTLSVKLLHYHNRVNLSDDELSLLKDSHEAIFSHLLRVPGSLLQTDFERSTKKYLIVPLCVFSSVCPVECYIDFSQAEKLASLKLRSSLHESRTVRPFPLDDVTDMIVETVHNQEADPLLYQVLKVDHTTTPKSSFPDAKVASTYRDYYLTKYNFDLMDNTEPALEVKQLGLGGTRLKMLVSRFKNHEGEDMKRNEQVRDIKLFPSLCSLYPVGSGLWHILRCLPSLLWRLECLLLIDSLRDKVTSATGIGECGESVLVVTKTNLRGYEDYGCGLLKTQQISFGENHETEVRLLPDYHLSDSVVRGPDNGLLLQALMPKGAKDSINLERLETLGDSFLKLSTSVFLFCDRPIDHEGKLSISREHRVGNFNLYQLAKQRNITSMLLSTAFEPRQMWTPPGFTFKHGLLSQIESDNVSQLSEEELRYLYHKSTDKGVADCVESLIGAYLVSGGIEAAVRFMKWIGIKLHRRQIPTKVPPTLSGQLQQLANSQAASSCDSSSHSAAPISQTSPMPNTGLFLFNSSAVFKAHFGRPLTSQLNDKQIVEMEKLLKICSAADVCKNINWEFSDRCLLLQALTHASYFRNRITDCYQRLEFLGDAILDYLVTCHIYHHFPRYSPGDISNLRSALVNNVTFAELAVELHLQKSFLHYSPLLFKQIEDYVRIFHRNCECSENSMTEELYCHSEHSQNLYESVSEDPCLDSDVVFVDELDPPKVLGDLLESLAGAIFLDSGMSLEKVWTVFRPFFQKRIDSFNGTIPVPPLQQLLEREPGAKVKCKSEKSQAGRFRCSITVLDKGIKIIAEANNAKTVKAAAARAALTKLNTHS